MVKKVKAALGATRRWLDVIQRLWSFDSSYEEYGYGYGYYDSLSLSLFFSVQNLKIHNMFKEPTGPELDPKPRSGLCLSRVL